MNEEAGSVEYVRLFDLYVIDWNSANPCDVEIGASSVMPFAYECAHCGKQFMRHTRVTKQRTFCSGDCYHAASRYPDRTCDGCGKAFNLRQGRQKHDRAFCGRECYDA